VPNNTNVSVFVYYSAKVSTCYY